jgi:predicted nucleotidyltransferase
MMTPVIEDISSIRRICRKYGVSSLAIFGSQARGEARPNSDIDMLVSFSDRVSLLTMVALERELTDLLGRQVDLQTEAALSPYLRDRILQERQVIYAS